MLGFSDDNTKIVVLHKEPKHEHAANDPVRVKNGKFEALINMLPKDDVRYAIVDVHFNTSEGPRTELVFVTWAPETANIKRRMLVASSNNALKNVLVGVKNMIQATCYPDLDLRNIIEEKLKGTLD